MLVHHAGHHTTTLDTRLGGGPTKQHTILVVTYLAIHIHLLETSEILVYIQQICQVRV